MRLTFETVILTIFFLLPGFVSTGIRRVILGRPSEPKSNWIVSSIFLSFVFLALTTAEFLAFGPVEVEFDSRPFQDPPIY